MILLFYWQTHILCRFWSTKNTTEIQQKSIIWTAFWQTYLDVGFGKINFDLLICLDFFGFYLKNKTICITFKNIWFKKIFFFFQRWRNFTIPEATNKKKYLLTILRFAPRILAQRSFLFFFFLNTFSPKRLWLVMWPIIPSCRILNVVDKSHFCALTIKKLSIFQNNSLNINFLFPFE